jgi:hypothetical protein
VKDPQTRAILQDIVRRESRSLLLYTADAFPWTTSDGEPRLAALRQAIREVADAVTALGRFLLKSRVTPPPAGAYPASFTSLNFVALSYLVPRLIEAERRSTAALEADLRQIKDAAGREHAAALLAHKQHALKALGSLLAPAGAEPSPSPAS